MESVNSVNTSKLQFSNDIKVDSAQMIQGQVSVSGHVPFTSSAEVLGASSSSVSKSLPNQQTILPVNIQSSALSLHQSGNLSSNTSNTNASSQPTQLFQSTNFDGCETVLNQQQSSAPTFLLAPPGTIVSQGQMFIQDNNGLVAVSLSTSSPPQYTTTVSNSNFENVSFMQNTSQSSNTPARIIIQTNPSSSASVQQPILSTSSGHYMLQVGNNYSSSTVNNLTVNNKGHIVIKSGGSKAKSKPLEVPTTSSKDGVFRVVIPEGTTKITRPNYPSTASNSGSIDPVKKHVQINLSNKPSPTVKAKSTEEYITGDVYPEGHKSRYTNKLYECPTCSNKFMRPVFLRMHMRSCKKPEVKLEKTPLFMCSFCKNTFRTKSQINVHFTKCSQVPYTPKSGKEKVVSDGKKGNIEEIDASLEQAVQYKCQDCDRTFNKERQYTSHIKRCTKVSVHDLSGARTETASEGLPGDENEPADDPFADIPLTVPSPKRGRGSSGRRGRPPGRLTGATKNNSKPNVLFEGEKVSAISNGLLVADNENLVRSTTGLAHAVQLSIDNAKQEGQPHPGALVSGPKGVQGKDKPPQAWSLVCSLCQKMFLTKAALASHVISNHGPELHNTKNALLGKTVANQELYKCPLCSLHYCSADTFIEHLVLRHTAKLQYCYANLQLQTGSFVCSLCSLVLLTKSLLLEHLSIEHLDDLEACVYRQKQGVRIKKEIKQESYDEKWNNNVALQVENDSGIGEIKLKSNGEQTLECSFCSEEIATEEALIQHYTEVHGMETDTDKSLLDLGIDVDIKVKDTKNLVELASGKLGNSQLPPKTVLLRKKPQQSWQCQVCSQSFNSQVGYVRHVREICGASDKKESVSREHTYFCSEQECSHLTFYQVKSLFKHMEETHSTTIHKERRCFKQLVFFNQWLADEEKKLGVKFVNENSKIERNIKLVQMVCQQFLSSRMEHAKEKEADLSKPTKKRWCIRLQRSSNCLARIHLRIELNTATNEYDGETQMIYYPDHCHNGDEDQADEIEKMMDRHPKNRALGVKNNGAVVHAQTTSSSLPADSTQKIISNSSPVHTAPLSSHMLISPFSSGSDISVTNSTDSKISYVPCFSNSSSILNSNTEATASNLLLIQDPPTKKKNPSSNILLQTEAANTSQSSSLILNPSSPSISSRNSILLTGPSSVANDALLVDNNQPTRLLVRNGAESQTMLISNEIGSNSNNETKNAESAVNSFMFQEGVVVGVEQNDQVERENVQEEYILPADESEWTKLFDVLKARLSASELNEEEKKEAEAIVNYQNVISMIGLSEQVSLFQKLCSLTNTSLESV